MSAGFTTLEEWLESEGLLAEVTARAQARTLLSAAEALIADVRSRYPGEEFRCQYMRALDEAVNMARGDAPTQSGGKDVR